MPESTRQPTSRSKAPENAYTRFRDAYINSPGVLQEIERGRARGFHVDPNEVVRVLWTHLTPQQKEAYARPSAKPDNPQDAWQKPETKSSSGRNPSSRTMFEKRLESQVPASTNMGARPAPTPVSPAKRDAIASDVEQLFVVQAQNMKDRIPRK